MKRQPPPLKMRNVTVPTKQNCKATAPTPSLIQKPEIQVKRDGTVVKSQPTRQPPTLKKPDQLLVPVQPTRSLNDRFALTPHVSVEALAGTGKTFTILEMCYRLLGIRRDIVGSEQQEAIWSFVTDRHKPSDIMITTFSSRTANELKAKCPPGMKEFTGTVHAFGKRLLGYNRIGNRKNDFQPKKSLILLAKSMDMSLDQMFRANRIKSPLYWAINQIVAFLKLNLVNPNQLSKEKIDSVIDLHGYVLPKLYSVEDLDFLYNKSEEIYKESYSETTMINYDDMLFLPWSLGLDVRPVPFLFVDERQDLNIAQQELVCRLGQRMFLAGDTNQAIYGFAGADRDASSRMEQRLQQSMRGIECFPLTLTRRCGKAIVEYARQFVPEFDYFDDAPDGLVSNDNEESFPQKIQLGDMVICRTNAPLFRICQQLMARGIPFKTTVSKFFTQTLGLIESFQADDLETLLSRLEEWHETQTTLYKNSAHEDKLIAIDDSYSSIASAIQYSRSYPDLIERIRKMSDDSSSDSNVSRDWVFLTSIHGAKGLEADKVWWLQYDKLPHPKAKLLDQERNLQWVASTRAKHELVLVESRDERTER